LGGIAPRWVTATDTLVLATLLGLSHPLSDYTLRANYPPSAATSSGEVDARSAATSSGDADRMSAATTSGAVEQSIFTRSAATSSGAVEQSLFTRSAATLCGAVEQSLFTRSAATLSGDADRRSAATTSGAVNQSLFTRSAATLCGDADRRSAATTSGAVEQSLFTAGGVPRRRLLLSMEFSWSDTALSIFLAVGSLDPTQLWPLASSNAFDGVSGSVTAQSLLLSVESLYLAQRWPSTLFHWAYNPVQSLDWSSVIPIFFPWSLLTRHGLGLRRRLLLSMEFFLLRYGAVYFSCRGVS
jgi:hypothetical protein